jgi:hypothetical protein
MALIESNGRVHRRLIHLIDQTVSQSAAAEAMAGPSSLQHHSSTRMAFKPAVPLPDQRCAADRGTSGNPQGSRLHFAEVRTAR